MWLRLAVFVYVCVNVCVYYSVCVFVCSAPQRKTHKVLTYRTFYESKNKQRFSKRHQFV